MYESNVGSTVSWPVEVSGGQSSKILPTPQSALALQDLAKASQDYAAAAESYVFARDRLNEAKSRWSAIRDQVAKASEQDGV